MGYRHYLGSIKKEDFEKIQTAKSKEELVKLASWIDEDDAYTSNIPRKLLLIIGAVASNDSVPKNPIFKDRAFNDLFNQDTALFQLPKEGLLQLIREYQKYVADQYKKLSEFYNSTDNIGWQSPTRFFKQRLSEWSQFDMDLIVDLRENVDDLVSAGDYEYQIFELVRIYKTFDFENEVLLVVAF